MTTNHNQINSLTTDEQETIEDDLPDINVNLSSSDVFSLRCCKLDGCRTMSWSTVVHSYRAAPKMLFRASPTQLNMRGVTGGTTRHKYDKKNLLSKDANGSEARVDLRVTGWASPVRSVRETAMGRYATCGPTCFKKRSGPDSMSGDARAFS